MTTFPSHGKNPLPPPGGVPSPKEELILGEVGQYTLLEPLGKGGMGRVYKAMHLRLKKIVALKMLPAHHQDHVGAISRFQREMEAIGRLEHPHIVRATDAGEAQGCHFLVMEYLEGLDLNKVVQRVGPLPISEACELIRQAAQGLEYIRIHGLVHRDIKPSNLFLTVSGQVKVLDLGLARIYQEYSKEEQITPSGQLLGTADYMAPEQVLDAHNVDIRSDVYSLGCSLYKLLAGRPPFSDLDSYHQKVMAHTGTPVPPIQNQRPDVPEGVVCILERMLAKNPEERFQTPAEAAAALVPFAEGSNLGCLATVQGESAPLNLETSESGQETRSHLSQTGTTYKPLRILLQNRLGSRWTRVFGGCLVLGVLAILGYSHFPGFKKGEENFPHIDEAPPNVWHNLLKKPPSVLYPFEESLNRRWIFDEKKQEAAIISTDDFLLLALGETKRQSYQIQVSLSQPFWTGRLGVFFGFQEFEDKEGSYQRCHWIELRPNLDSFTLVRKKVTILPNKKNISGPEIAVPVDTPNQPEQFLTIMVAKNGLADVRWGGAKHGGFTGSNITGFRKLF